MADGSPDFHHFHTHTQHAKSGRPASGAVSCKSFVSGGVSEASDRSRPVSEGAERPGGWPGPARAGINQPWTWIVPIRHLSRCTFVTKPITPLEMFMPSERGSPRMSMCPRTL